MRVEPVFLMLVKAQNRPPIGCFGRQMIGLAEIDQPKKVVRGQEKREKIIGCIFPKQLPPNLQKIKIQAEIKTIPYSWD